MSERLERMEIHIDSRLDAMNERLESLMKWTVGMIGTVGAVIAVLITIFKFVG